MYNLKVSFGIKCAMKKISVPKKKEKKEALNRVEKNYKTRDKMGE